MKATREQTVEQLFNFLGRKVVGGPASIREALFEAYDLGRDSLLPADSGRSQRLRAENLENKRRT